MFQIAIHITVFILISSTGNTISPDYLIELSSIGIPAYEREQEAWRINDLFAFDDRLYIGTGDAVINTGPTDVIYYDLITETFVYEFKVDEEAIYRYEKINDRLMIPGTDATEDWSYGNIYIRSDTSWIKYRTLPKALHVMYLIQYQDRLVASTVTEALIGESLPSYHGAIYVSPDTGENWELLYLTPSDGNNVFHLDALAEFNRELYAFAYAHCGLKESSVPEEYRSSLGEPYEDHYQIINHDVLGMNDVICFNGDRWSYKDFIPGEGVARIVKPIVFKDQLVLPLIRGKYIDYLKSRDLLPDHAECEIYMYNGKKTKQLKIMPELVISTGISNDTLFILFKQDYYFLAVITDPKKILYYQLPSKIGTIRAFEYHGGIFYFGNAEGYLYESTALTDLKNIQQPLEFMPKKCIGIMPRDAVIESGWVTMYERIDSDSLAKITADILDNNALRVKTTNLRQFKIVLPDYYLNLNKHIILLVDNDIAFDGRFHHGDEVMCRRSPNGKWQTEILRTRKNSKP